MCLGVTKEFKQKFEMFGHKYSKVDVLKYKDAVAVMRNSKVLVIHGQVENYDYLRDYIERKLGGV